MRSMRTYLSTAFTNSRTIRNRCKRVRNESQLKIQLDKSNKKAIHYIISTGNVSLFDSNGYFPSIFTTTFCFNTSHLDHTTKSVLHFWFSALDIPHLYNLSIQKPTAYILHLIPILSAKRPFSAV